MPWTLTRFPLSMSRVPEPLPEVPNEIADGLLEGGMEGGKAIRIAIPTAREWARRHGL